MTLLERTQLETRTARTDLVWDLPNCNATLTDLTGPQAVRRYKSDFSALARFLVLEAERPETAAGTVFMNIPQDPRQIEGFVTSLRRHGFGVFVKPRSEKSDIDDDLVAHVAERAEELGHLLIGTHDRELLQRCIAEVPETCTVTVLGFEEYSRWAADSGRVRFVDLEDVPGMFATALPRCLLRRVPTTGALLPPLGSLPTASVIAAVA